MGILNYKQAKPEDLDIAKKRNREKLNPFK